MASDTVMLHSSPRMAEGSTRSSSTHDHGLDFDFSRSETPVLTRPSMEGSNLKSSMVTESTVAERTPQRSSSTTPIPPPAASPLSTSNVFPHNSASSKQEEVYLRQTRWLRWIRFGLSVLVLLFAGAVLACEGHILNYYNSTHRVIRTWRLPSIWPIGLDFRPTIAVLVPAAIACALTLVYVVTVAVPSPRSRTTMHNRLFGLSSSAGLIATAVGLIYSPLVISHVGTTPERRETIQTWTCKICEGARSFNDDAAGLRLNLAGDVADSSLLSPPTGFQTMCTESRVGYGLTAALVALEVLCVMAAVCGWYIERQMGRVRRSQCQKQAEVAVDPVVDEKTQAKDVVVTTTTVPENQAAMVKEEV